MNQIFRVAIVLLFVLMTASARQGADNRQSDRFAAAVIEQKGACYVRDNKDGKPRRLKIGERLQAGQELQCKENAYLRIRFRASGAEKEIKKSNPDWYVIGNVPGPASEDSGQRAGRKKSKRRKKPPRSTIGLAIRTASGGASA